MRTLAVVLLVAACGDEPRDPLRATIETGTLVGLAQDGTTAFLGIPYAAPPVGPLRFKPPQPAAAWEGEREVLVPADACPQALALAGAGVEDCLYLNVWVPHGDGPKPVMVWLHGGAFIFGSGGDAYYSGEHLAAEHDVIVVSPSYRLGAFGFLAHPTFAAEDPAYPSSGNWGIDDQYAALAWVQRNIAAFGGDAGNVTLFGESAGGYSTCVHYAAQRTAGLFHAAISQSGLCTTDVLELSREDAQAAAVDVATTLGCTSGDIAACLRGKTQTEITDATNPLPMNAPAGGPFYQVGPTLPTLPHVDGVVIERSLREAFATGAFPADRPLIVGATRDEGTLFHTSLFATPVTTEEEYRAALAKRFGAANVDAIAERYPIASFSDANRAIAEVSGDAFFVCAARRTARAVSAHAPVYYYNFQQEPAQAFMPGLGVFHSAEIPFLFGTDPRYPLARAGDDQPAAATIQALWTQFARTHTVGDEWPAYGDSDEHLAIANTTATGSGYKSALCDFWDSL